MEGTQRKKSALTRVRMWPETAIFAGMAMNGLCTSESKSPPPPPLTREKGARGDMSGTKLYGFLDSKETVVLRRWESDIDTKIWWFPICGCGLISIKWSDNDIKDSLQDFIDYSTNFTSFWVCFLQKHTQKGSINLFHLKNYFEYVSSFCINFF